jgi:Protein of unknown function (DUF1236)
MRPFGTFTVAAFTVGSALMQGGTIAQAQTAVTRQITREPVETVVIQGPGGTAVTRRILRPEPGISTYAPPPLEYPPVAAGALAPEYVEPAAPFLTTRRMTESRYSTAAPARTRAATTQRASPRPLRTMTRIVTVPTAPSDQALALSPAQRQVIYRTIVQREYYPAPAPAQLPVVARTDVYAPPPAAGYPPPATGYPLRTVYPADDAYGRTGYRDYASSPDPYPDRGYDNLDPYHTAYRWDGVPLVVGARIPQSVPLVAVPEQVVARVPAARSYGYAVLDDRVYLVDPATNIIMAEITR